ncbi:MAG: BACON domain-containing carbohydrate-binding protein [Odoribacter sp.]
MMKKHRTGFLVLMLNLAFALTFNACDDEDAIETNVDLNFTPNVVLSNDGASETVDLKLSDRTAWRVEVKGEEADWCEVTPAFGKGAGRFVITVSANEKRTARQVELAVTAGTTVQTMSVYQKDTMNVAASDNMVVPNGGDTLDIAVEANTAWEVIRPVFARWVSFTPTHGQGKGVVRFIVGNNDLLRARSVDFVFSAGTAQRTISISQQDMTPTSASDSLALIALYRAMDGAYWKKPWDLEKGISTWTGVTTALVNNELRVTKLLLSSNNLDGVIPSEIGNFSALEELDLSFNSIHGEIPVEIGHLSALKILNINNDKFDGELPLSIGRLSQLEELNAQGNRFKTFPVEICALPKLSYLHLNENEISSLPGEIAQMSALKYLYLNNNRLTALPKGLNKMAALIYLHADHNMITEFPTEIGELINLVSLKLDNNKITGTIPAGLSKLIHLKYLYLSGNTFTGGLPDLSKMEDLEVIEAYACGLTGAIPEFGKVLTSLETIWLSDNHLTGELVESIAKMTNLRQLILDDNELTGILPQALGNLKNNKMLGLANNKITGTVPENLGAWLAAYPKPSSTSFRLNGNYLTGMVPKKVKGYFNDTQFNFAVNLYPQRDGVVLVQEK